jgi:hypothetical protein
MVGLKVSTSDSSLCTACPNTGSITYQLHEKHKMSDIQVFLTQS